MNFALILVIRPLELGPLDRALGKEGDEPHSLRRVSKIRSKVGKEKNLIVSEDGAGETLCACGWTVGESWY